MKLTTILHSGSILSSIESTDKQGALCEIAAFMEKAHPEIQGRCLSNILSEREALGSTGIGNGVAIPHGKMNGINHLVACLARSRKGIGFDAVDGQKVQLFFVLVAPEKEASLHLKALARMARLMRSDRFRRDILEADTSSEIFSIVLEEDQRV